MGLISLLAPEQQILLQVWHSTHFTSEHPCRFPALYLFRYFNMRTEQFKELRQELQDSSRRVGLLLCFLYAHASA